jgi:hypothetical protein
MHQEFALLFVARVDHRADYLTDRPNLGLRTHGIPFPESARRLLPAAVRH